VNDRVDVQILAVTPNERAVLSALLELYVYDFSESLPLDVGEDGRFHGPPLDAYFAEPTHHAFLVRVGDHWAGFALVQERSRLNGDPTVRDMAEFFVLRRYRLSGVGEKMAAWLFDRFGGRWEVRQKAENRPATAFWRRIIGRYTGGHFEDLALDDHRWRGPVQRFDCRDAVADRRRP
jgi:predicted acetyltransferase